MNKHHWDVEVSVVEQLLIMLENERVKLEAAT